MPSIFALSSLLLTAAAGLTLALAPAARAQTDPWTAILQEARGQTVYWHAWGGDERTNAFIDWVGTQTQTRYGVAVRQVKLSDTAEAVARVTAERAAGQTSGGAVDLIWINGPNFLAMREAGLLHGPFVQGLPNAARVDLSPGSAAATDFTVPTEGFESPWRLARFVFVHDSARLPDPPRSMAAMVDWAARNPGRLTHPDPSNFMGATFLKQALIELAPDAALLQAAPDDAVYAQQTAPLWAWYDALRPHLWRGGQSFPENQSIQRQLLADGEIDIAMSFDPASTAGEIIAGLLPDTARVFVPDGGTLGNISFVAIPSNAASRAGAMVVANFLLDPETQAHQQNIAVLGSYSVLDPARLTEAEAALFANLPTAPALPTLQDLGPTLIEPHPGWMSRIAQDWARRYR